MYIWISLGIKFQHKRAILIFLTKSAQKGYFRSNTEKSELSARSWYLLTIKTFSYGGQETQQHSSRSSYRDSNVNYQILSVIKEKDESQDKGYKKTKHAKFSKKRTFLPLDTSAYQKIRNASFSEILACFVFL